VLTGAPPERWNAMASRGAPARDPARTCGRIGPRWNLFEAVDKPGYHDLQPIFPDEDDVPLHWTRPTKQSVGGSRFWQDRPPPPRTKPACTANRLHLNQENSTRVDDYTHKHCVKDARQNCYSCAAACICN